MGKNDSFNLTISPDLFYRWELENAISEILQNAIDEYRETENPYFVEHDKDTLRVANKFARLEKDALIAGFSTKRSIQSSIGKFGIGLPAALSTLARLDISCEVKTQDQIWKPSLIRDPNFNNAEVTRINVRNRRDGREIKFDGVEIFISPITSKEWEVMKERFLFLGTQTRIETSRGAILTDSAQKGRIYTKGIFVQEIEGYGFGFDLQYIEIDMERKLTDTWSLEFEIGKVLREAFINNPEKMLEDIWGKLLTNAKDVNKFVPSTYEPTYAKIQTALVSKFKKEYGEDSIPVESVPHAIELQHHGKIGVVVPEKIRNIIGSNTGTYESVKKSKEESWDKIWNLSELSEIEIKNLTQSLDMVTKALGFPIPENVIVASLAEGKDGLYKSGTIVLGKHTLAQLTDTDSTAGVLRILVHEYSHNYGSDGTIQHARAMEKLWGKIVKNLLP
jgi:hypothetical protein